MQKIKEIHKAMETQIQFKRRDQRLLVLAGKSLISSKPLKLTMKIRLQILRWLSLMEFPAFAGCQVRKLSHYALFRQKQSFDRAIMIKKLKT